MTLQLQNRCEDFIGKCELMKACFPLSNRLIQNICAAILANKQAHLESAKIKEGKEYLKNQVGFFSYFKGNLEPIVVTALALKEDYRSYMDKVKIIYDKMNKSFKKSEYLALSALTIADIVSVEEVDIYIEKARQIYDSMKKNHPWLTSGQDCTLAIFLAFSEKSVADLEREMEYIYESLKNKYGKGNSLQTVSHILTMQTKDINETQKKFDALYDSLKNAGVSYGKYYQLPVLATVALTDAGVKELTESICNAEAFLKTQKGYKGVFGIDKHNRYMHATILVLGYYSKNQSTSGELAAITSTLAIIAAEQAALMAAVVGSNAAMVSSAN